MRMLCAVAAVSILISGSAFAQDRGARGGRAGGAGRGEAPPATDPTVGTVKTAAELNAALAKLGTDRPNASVPVFRLAPYAVNIEHRANQPQTASIHDNEAEMFIVIDGSATFVTGGKVVGETRNGANVSGKSIEGGTPHKIGKGDFIMVPKGVPHWFSQIDGTVLNIMSFHLPMPN
jgi:mannose-6-phosphate isomerase-like protein (cupin superfamily)